MLRKIVHIVLVIFLMVLTTGISISKHYCGEEIVRISLSSEHQSCCAEGEFNCCKIIKEKIQLVDNYLASRSNCQFVDVSKKLQFVNHNLFKDTFYLTLIAHTQKYNNYNFPPPQKTKAILARLQTYLL